MPPKKSFTNGDAKEAGGKFTWDGPNDTKLLLLMQGRYVKPDEYDMLSAAFPNTTPGGIRNRISALRVKQRKLYEEMGWQLPEGAAGHSTKKSIPNSTPKKRDSGHEDEMGTPSKKPRAKKGGGKKKVEEESDEGGKNEEDDDDDAGLSVDVDCGNGVLGIDTGMGMGMGVKEEEEVNDAYV